MVSINNCGPNCADCRPQGCVACTGFIQLVGVNCKGCIEGFVANGSDKCVACRSECLTCDLISSNCTSCYDGYTAIRGECLLNPNILLFTEELTAYSLSTISTADWTYK
jgi:hypothetical protein